ncbi:MAG: 4Fe-4S dicluster domain-containing protein [Desulfobacteraceae bacterium]|nr:4Fe-4S dicluster domain-containing protein [Desulfobacteraceae bacterium]
MKEWLLKKDSVKALCVSASGQWETYVPLESFGGDVRFMRLDSEEKGLFLDKLNLDYESLVVPPKAIVFPQLESLFRFQDEKIIETVKPKVPRLLFGLRACDVKAILFMDDFFKRNFEDIYYLNRSMDKLLVIVGCKHPTENCFCTSTKTGPFLETGFDLQLVDIGNKYVVEIGSEKGEEFVSSYRKFFDEASKDDVECSKIAKHDAEEAVSLRLDFEKAIKKFCEDKVPRQMYERIAERCIYCGGCIYVCPTCSCFNVFDDLKAGLGGRYRNWDACVFEGYTREASGHNPRSEKWIRTSRRYEHKLKYDYLTTGMSGCVGCGKCLSSCPVNIGISQVIEEVSKN